jgi:uncharacterized phage protein (TIGR02220 family)
MSKLPAIQFYPGDWMKDPAVRSVSIDARGLWIDMLCLMHESTRRGYLQHSTGEPVTEEQLARITGCTQKQVARLLGELTTTGVFSCTDTGVIYNRRMVRDEEIRVIRAESGSMGGRPKKQNESKTKANEKQNITPSSSSSSSKDLKSVCDTRATYPPHHSQSGQDLHCDALAILNEVNERCGKHFPDHYAAGLAVIKDRLIEGRTHDEFSRIIDVKLHDPLFQQKPNLYDPRTLFATADRFDAYLNQDPEGFNGNTDDKGTIRGKKGIHLGTGKPYPDDTPN